jgi:hypothetical protein
MNHYIWFDVEEYDNQEDITKITFILSSNKSVEEKIKQIYQITMNIKYAKLLYYNFEFNQYIKDKRMGLVK